MPAMGEWETIDSNTVRMKVVGGWVVRYQEWDALGTITVAVATCYVPDNKHSWVLP